MLLFRFLLSLLTVFGTLFPIGLNFDYKHLPIEFKVETVSDIYVPADNNSNVVEYPSIIKLRYQKNDADNGKLLSTFEKWGDTYPIYESNDDAETWQYVCTVKDNLNEGY